MYHVVVNFNAGENRVRRNLALLEKELSARSLPYKVYATACPGDATRIAADITSPYLTNHLTNHLTKQKETADVIEESTIEESTIEEPTIEEPTIVVVGGDGTLHEVLNGLADPACCKLGLIPSGTGNDFAAAAGISENAKAAIELLLDGEAKLTDYLTVGGVRCMNVAGMGMDVDVLVRCRKGKLKGKIKYLISLIKSLFVFRGHNITMETEDGQKESRTSLLFTACNGTQIGGGIRICPASVLDDGKMDVMTVKYLSMRRVIHAFWYLMRGKVLDYPAAEHYLCKKIKAVAEKPCTVQLDGELYEGLPFEAEIRRGLKFYR